MAENYIKKILKTFPDIASGRKKFKYYEKRITKNLKLTNKYIKEKIIKRKNKPV